MSLHRDAYAAPVGENSMSQSSPRHLITNCGQNRALVRRCLTRAPTQPQQPSYQSDAESKSAIAVYSDENGGCTRHAG